MPISSEDFDSSTCQACGACCVSHWDCETYIYVGNDDVRRLRLAYTERKVRRIIGGLDDPINQGLWTKKNKQGHVVCISLRGSVGKQCSCSIYDARPKVCRGFKPGSDCCKLAREEAGVSG